MKWIFVSLYACYHMLFSLFTSFSLDPFHFVFHSHCKRKEGYSPEAVSLFLFLPSRCGVRPDLCAGALCVCTAAGVGIFPAAAFLLSPHKSQEPELKFLQLQANYQTQTITSRLLWSAGWQTAELRINKKSTPALIMSRPALVHHPTEKEGSSV